MMWKVVYHGAKVNKQGGSASDIRAQLGKAKVSFNKLNKVWKSSLFSRKTKITIFKTSVVAVFFLLWLRDVEDGQER